MFVLVREAPWSAVAAATALGFPHFFCPTPGQRPSCLGLIVTHIFGWTPWVPWVHVLSPHGVPHPALRDQANEGVKELTTEAQRH